MDDEFLIPQMLREAREPAPEELSAMLRSFADQCLDHRELWCYALMIVAAEALALAVRSGQ